MTNQQKKKKLKSYHDLDIQIDRLLEEKARWRARAMKVSPSYSPLPKAAAQEDSTQSCIERVVLLEGEINRKIDALILLKREIEGYIQTVNNPTLRLLLQLRYIDGYTWEKVAEKLHYDYRHVTKLHGKALSLLKMP